MVPMVARCIALLLWTVVGVWSAEGWSTTGKIGLFGSSVTTRGAEGSRDPAISGTSDATSLQGRIDTGLDWRGADHSLDQKVLIHYGTVHQRRDGWQENADEIRYDGVARKTLREPQFLYFGWGLESVFNGPPPERYSHDPTTLRVSLGYGQLFEGLMPLRDKLEARLGVRSQKRWGPSLGDDQRDIETGPEGYLHYDRRVSEDWSFQAQYEVFSEFRDLGHVTQLATAGLDVSLAKHLTLVFAMRAFRESRPANRPEREGYDTWSLRQETLIGITASW